MLPKLLTFFLTISLVASVSPSNAGNKDPVKIVNNGDVLRGDTGPIVYAPPAPLDRSPKMPNMVSSTDDPFIPYVILTELSAYARTNYDLQSNGVIHYLYMDPANPLHMHAVFMTSTDPGPNWTDRNTRYFYTEDGGNNWSYYGTVGVTRSGFPCLTQTPDGRALISMHNTDAGGIQRLQLYIDLGIGLGVFNRINPPLTNPTLGEIWGVCAGTNTKAFFVGSQNSTSFDSAKVNTVTSFSVPAFLGWQNINNARNSQNYAVAIGTGKWGIAYNGADNGAYLIESTNEGVSWGSPVTIWTYNEFTDSLGTLRSIDMIYEGSNARVTFGLCHIDPFAGTFYPGLSSKQMFWGPDVNGGFPVTIDQADGLSGSNPTNDVFVSCCRGTIGKDASNNLFVAYNKARQDISPIGNNYFDVWISYSSNHGLTWSAGDPMTNLIGQGILADYRYVSISPYNTNSNIYLVCTRDTIPGSSVNGAPASTMREMFMTISSGVVFVHNINNEIPGNYLLHQNYPNPFNPSTKIKFELPTSGFVSIKLYDVSGKEISTIVNENLSAGVKETDFDASNLSSGVYFYIIRTNNFTQTKKMVLLK